MVSMTYWKKNEVVGGRYRIVRMIGQGGMGVVYAVEDMKLPGTLRAMKATLTMPGGIGVYSEEASTLMRLQHPNLPLIVDYFPPQDYGEVSDVEVLVMDYIDGETLASLLSGSRLTYTFSEVIHIAVQLCSALQYLHGQASPIIHRDLKPSNVMIDNNGLVKLIDFGISRSYKEGQKQDTIQLGTVGFAAPEQSGTGQSDVRTDIYGLGSLLCFMASGGASALRQQVRSNGVNPIYSYDMTKDTPHMFRVVLDRMTQTNPEHRFQSMAEVEQSLSVFGRQQLDLGSGHIDWTLHKHRTRPALVTVLSLSPGAGATMVAITMAALLGRRGNSVTAAEYAGMQPEWSRLLTHKKFKETEEEGVISYVDRHEYSPGKAGRVNWLANHSDLLSDREQDVRLFEQKLKQYGSSIHLIDLSSSWKEANALYWVRQSKYVFVVADPFLARWQAERIQNLLLLGKELARHGGSMHWIANKDVKFRGRKEWLSMFPQRPIAVVPLLTQELVLDTIWTGQWLTDDARLGKRLDQALIPAISLVSGEIHTK